jgi:hypothetical protein
MSFEKSINQVSQNRRTSHFVFVYYPWADIKLIVERLVVFYYIILPLKNVPRARGGLGREGSLFMSGEWERRKELPQASRVAVEGRAS